jgi:hypothetical protein
MSNPRHHAAARTLFNVEHGYAPDDTEGWGSARLVTQQEYITKAAVLVPALDAADDRIRLTMPEFNAIKAQALRDITTDLYARFGSGLQAEVASYLEERRGDYERFIEPVNHEQAMESLILERLAAALNRTADFFDAASLDSITCEMDLDAEVPPRFKRRMINGCADWLRDHARELTANRARPYYRVNTRAVIDQDRYEASLRVVGQLIQRAKDIASLDGRHYAFLMADDLQKALEDVGAVIPEPADA